MPAGWIGEGGSRTETTTSDLVEVAPTFGTIYARPKASEEAVADIFFDVGEWLVSEVADSFSAAEATAIWSGNGSNRPSGLKNITPVSTADNASPERAATALQYRPIAGAASALVLNAVLRLGIPRNASLRWRLEAAGMLKNFAEMQGRAWTARVDLIRRVGNFLEEFAALAPRVMLRGSEAALELRYDETGLQIDLSWQGKARQAPTPRRLAQHGRRRHLARCADATLGRCNQPIGR